MRKIQILAFVYLCVLLGGLWGYGVGKYAWWPASLITEVTEFAAGDDEEANTSFVEKIQNDTGVKPTRKLVRYNARETHPDRTYAEVALPGKKARRQDPLVHLAENAPKRLRVVYGSFDMENSLNGAVLLDERGQVLWYWDVNQDGLDWKLNAPEERAFPHGLIVEPNGDIIFTFDNGSSIQRFDKCSKRIWATRSGADHSLAKDSKGQVWTIVTPKRMSVFNAKTGKHIRAINMEKFMAKNPEIDPLGLRQKDYGRRWAWAEKGGSYWHPNDVEPLPKSLASVFPQFEVDDLLVSFRSINGVFVVSPKTFKIKWWRLGAWRRQHDPDWQPDGTITVYNNNMHRGVSSIVKIDPRTFATKTLYDGQAEKFYTWMRGKHEVLDDGSITISSPQQGRVFEVNAKGEVVFEFVNRYDKDNALLVSELIALPLDYFGDSLKRTMLTADGGTQDETV